MVTFPTALGRGSRSIKSVRLLSEGPHHQLKVINHSLFSCMLPIPPASLPAHLLAKCSLTHDSFVQIEAKSAFSVKLGGNCRRTNGPRCYLGRIGQSLAAWAPPSTECLNFAFSCIPSFTLHPNLPSITLPHRTAFFGFQLLQGVFINRCT